MALEAVENITSLFQGNFYNFLFINAGTALVLFLIPSKDRIILGLKGIALIFIISNLYLGYYREYRIFLELTPLALYALDKAFIYNNDNFAQIDILNKKNL